MDKGDQVRMLLWKAIRPRGQWIVEVYDPYAIDRMSSDDGSTHDIHGVWFPCAQRTTIDMAIKHMATETLPEGFLCRVRNLKTGETIPQEALEV